MAQFCLVTQKLGVYVEDGPDEDHLPDRYQINGKVTFTPNITAGDSFKIVEGNDVVVMPAVSVTADIINGQITHNGQTGVYLFAAGENSNPTEITYTVAYTDLWAGETDGEMWAGKQQLSLRGLTFLAVPNGSVDLGEVTPVAGTPGVGITKGDKGDKGDPFRYEDFTPEQLEEIQGAPGETWSAPVSATVASDLGGKFDPDDFRVTLSKLGPLTYVSVEANPEKDPEIYQGDQNVILEATVEGYFARGEGYLGAGAVMNSGATISVGNDGVARVYINWNNGDARTTVNQITGLGILAVLQPVGI